ncbi:hypothetical protein SJA_C1-29320 [Sphingobium indicum UT26S]|uniref:Uncharacterized protein n=1 Tax=Sphingobium indicum (strain DSM 16413 / CCM 7287 / MTCC 6362 / UT26 / NBRC 101211 / UT26S) TaxID=452662 RepID=D4Z584_SPHIU|nr:hypothetical protein SJA_C1-29320 [Sphingobium indicum UT26S]
MSWMVASRQPPSRHPGLEPGSRSLAANCAALPAVTHRPQLAQKPSYFPQPLPFLLSYIPRPAYPAPVFEMSIRFPPRLRALTPARAYTVNFDGKPRFSALRSDPSSESA